MLRRRLMTLKQIVIKYDTVNPLYSIRGREFLYYLTAYLLLKMESTWRNSNSTISISIFFPCGAAAHRRPWPPHSWGFYNTHDTSQSVALLWTSDQLVAETCTCTTLTTDRYPWPRRDSNPQSTYLRRSPRGHWDRHSPLVCLSVGATALSGTGPPHSRGS